MRNHIPVTVVAVVLVAGVLLAARPADPPPGAAGAAVTDGKPPLKAGKMYRFASPRGLEVGTVIEPPSGGWVKFRPVADGSGATHWLNLAYVHEIIEVGDAGKGK